MGFETQKVWVFLYVLIICIFVFNLQCETLARYERTKKIQNLLSGDIIYYILLATMSYSVDGVILSIVKIDRYVKAQLEKERLFLLLDDVPVCC